MTDPNNAAGGRSWVDAEREDSFDEELEMEIDDLRVAEELRGITDRRSGSALDRRTYFRELFRLQSELVSLQDWVRHSGYKLVVLFEGRDSAGKGGTIKRASPSASTRASAASSSSRPRPSASGRSGTSSATSRIYRPAARSSCSTAPGTTAPASSG
jgi:polyphosphate kinase 2 (PPK2 family)